MRHLKVLICLLDNDVEPLNQAFDALYFHYGFEKISITGVIQEGKLYVQGKEIDKVPFDEVPDVLFDYVIVSESNTAGSDKQSLAEQLHVPSESIIFDFELYNETFTFPKVCLVVIFNHRYDKNLPLLRKIYGGQFSEIRFLMPFYDGSDADVIPVYESSHQFQGYFIQAYDKLKDIQCTHYLFIGDDLIINLNFDEMNVVARTNMYGKKFLTTNFAPLNSPNMFRWTWVATSSKPFYDRFTTWKDSLYSYGEAMSKFNNFFGEKYKEFYDEAFFGDPNEPGSNSIGGWNNSKDFLRNVEYFVAINGNTLHIPYPMARGYSDIFCIDKANLFEFSRLCGIFSGMNMFCEIAIPTAVVLLYKRNDVKLLKNSPKFSYKKTLSIESGLILWGNERIAFENRYNKDFSKLLKEWDERIICIHPIKLSGWKNV